MLTLSRAARRTAAAVLLLPGFAGAQNHSTDEIVVTGVVRDSTLTDLGQSVTVIRDDALARARSATLGETLESQLGVSSSYFGSGASRPIIRGLGGARVRVLEDGIGAMDAASISDDHAVSIDPLVAQQVEIFRGPTTLLYGSGAVGGVVNTVTTRIPEAAPAQALDGALELRGDTASDDRSAAVRLDGGGNAFAWHFDALARDRGDYELPSAATRDANEHDVLASGLLENSALRSDAAALGASWLGERGFFGAALSTFETSYGVPGHHEHEDEHDTDANDAGAPPVRIELEQTRLDLKSGWAKLSGAIEGVNLRIGVNDYEHVELEGAAEGTVFTNAAREARLELLHRPFGAWTGAVGVHLSDGEFAALGAEAFVPPVDTTAYGVFVVEQLELSRWQLSFGGRLETQEHRPDGGRTRVDGSAGSVSFAAVRDLQAGYSLALNAARAERLPAAEELYSDGPHLATRAIQIGDSALREETSRHLDVGLRKTGDGVAWNVTAFRTHYDDFIYLRDTGVVEAREELPIFVFAQQGATFTGIEAELFMPIVSLGAGELDVRVFADYVRGRLADGADLPRMPPLRYGARLQYHDANMTAGIEATAYDDQTDVAAFEEPTDGYTMINADFVRRIATRGRLELNFFVYGSNLRDTLARKHTSFVKDVAPLPGRNYAIGVRSRF